MTFNCTYFPRLDRFAVSPCNQHINKSMVTRYSRYQSAEYNRYIPMKGVSLDKVDNFLLQFPHEFCCEITNSCNIKCQVCIADAPARQPVHLKLDVLASAIEQLPNTVTRITVTGGEPTVHPDLPALMRCCAVIKGGVVLSTNGFKPQATIDALEAAPGSILAVSLHGPKVVHDAFVGRSGSYDRAVETIRIAEGHCIGIYVYSMATEETFPTLSVMSQALSELPIIEQRINLVKPGGRTIGNAVPYDTVLKSLRGMQVPHKVSIKNRDQPFLFMNYYGSLEVHREQRY